MTALDLVVPVGGDHETRRRVDSPAEHAQRVQGRLVRPVQVFQDEHETARELRQDGTGDHARIARVGDRAGKTAARLPGDIDERSERCGRREVLARPTQDAEPWSRAERAHEGRLADAGLAADEHEPATLLGRRSEGRQQLVPLEEDRHSLHVCALRAAVQPSGLARPTGPSAYDRWMAVVETPRAGGLLEREEPLERLRAAFAGACDGRGALLFVGGEAGVGKTALAQRFTDELDADVLWGRCDPFVTPPPSGRCSRSPRGRALAPTLPGGRGRPRDRDRAPRPASRPRAPRARPRGPPLGGRGDARRPPRARATRRARRRPWSSRRTATTSSTALTRSASSSASSPRRQPSTRLVVEPLSPAAVAELAGGSRRRRRASSIA